MYQMNGINHCDVHNTRVKTAVSNKTKSANVNSFYTLEDSASYTHQDSAHMMSNMGSKSEVTHIVTSSKSKTIVQQLVPVKSTNTRMSQTSQDRTESDNQDKNIDQQIKEAEENLARLKDKKEQDKKSQENPGKLCMQPNQGLVVVCIHSAFQLKSHPSLSARPASFIDLKKMEHIWRDYGCDVLCFENETTSFYREELVNKIVEKVENVETLPDNFFFALIISSHGEEKAEGKVSGETSHFQHYFYACDGQIQTKKLINDIAKQKVMMYRKKMFFIQACSSRVYPDEEEYKNADFGFDVRVQSTDDKSVLEQRKYSGRTTADAGAIRTEYYEFIKKILLEFIPAAMIKIGYPRECIVMFASMAGKMAYSYQNSKYAGGWLIESLAQVLQSVSSREKVHILDVLTKVNDMVGRKETDNQKENAHYLKAQSCILFNITEDFYLQRS